MGKYKGYFIGKQKDFQTEKVHQLFIEMEVLDNNVEMDLSGDQTRFLSKVFKKEFKEDVFNEILEVCKNIDIERKCFNIKIQFENCIDSKAQKEFLSKKMSEYSKELSDSSTYFYYTKSEKEFRDFALRNIDIKEIYQYVHDKLKDNIRGYFYESYYCVLSNLLIIEYLKTLSLEPISSNKVPTPLKMQILLLDKIRNISSDKWDDLSNNKKGEILAKLLNRDSHTIRTKTLKILGKNSTLSYADKEIIEKCNTYWDTLDI
ncbi:hypothetical protein [Tenacibaculum dicentrarchi]|uniref:hypothetical protein n=1 Tax=Tenacibaculum dicentrarchi TaxID=669041 RepID=UPI003513CBED